MRRIAFAIDAGKQTCDDCRYNDDPQDSLKSAALRWRWCRMFNKDLRYTRLVAGKHQRVRLPECMERDIGET